MDHDSARAERRRERRYGSGVRLVVLAGGREVAAVSEDVSFSGVFVRVDAPLPERQLVRLRLRLPPEGDELEVMGVVARRAPAARGLPPGVGIRLFALGREQRARWDRFVAGVRGAASAPRRLAERRVAARGGGAR